MRTDQHPPTFPDSLSLEATRAVVVGGTSGLGAAVVTRLAAAGSHVIAVGRSAPDATAAMRTVLLDATSADAPARLLRELGDEPLDIVVHVVGGSRSPAGGHAALTDEL